MAVPNGYGTVFKMDTNGTAFSVLKHFAGSPGDGGYPQSGLVWSGSHLYGTTYRGGTNDRGTVFTLDTNGAKYQVLRAFPVTSGTYPNTNTEGAYPAASLLLSGSTLYGTAYGGGANGMGTLFAMDTNGTGFTVLKHFAGAAGDGANPSAGLALGGGILYGTTSAGGSSGMGTVFKLNTNGTDYTVLRSFPETAEYVSAEYPCGIYTNSDGANPSAALVLGGTALYGTTAAGGSSGAGTVFKMNTDGTGFTVLKNFPSWVSDALPACPSELIFPTCPGGGLRRLGGAESARLVLNGCTLYGTTTYGGRFGKGTVFKINTDGTGYKVLEDFAGHPNDGANPRTGLVLSGNTLYGTTSGGGSLGAGTIFSLPGLVLEIGWSSGHPQLGVSAQIGSHIALEWVAALGPSNYWQGVMNHTNVLLTNSPQ